MGNEFVTVVGGGPAGIAAAVQLQRSGLNPLLVEKEALGGLLRNAFRIENFPGFPGGIGGPSLVRRLEKQAERIGLRVIFDEVLRLDVVRGRFVLKTGRRLLQSGIVVVATGTRAKPPAGLEIDPEARRRVVSEIVPIGNVSGRDIAVIGAGDAAMDYALNLARANRVIVFDRGDSPRCLPLLLDRVLARPRIRYIPKTRIERVGPAGPRAIYLEGRGPSGTFLLKVDYLVTAVGREPSRDFLTERLDRASRLGKLRGRLHFVGDVKNGLFRQASIAVGDGVRAAMKIAAESKTGQLAWP